eukprot:11825861-Heterocapsa_arctica.AAC.1
MGTSLGFIFTEAEMASKVRKSRGRSMFKHGSVQQVTPRVSLTTHTECPMRVTETWVRESR